MAAVTGRAAATRVVTVYRDHRVVAIPRPTVRSTTRLVCSCGWTDTVHGSLAFVGDVARMHTAEAFDADKRAREQAARP